MFGEHSFCVFKGSPCRLRRKARIEDDSIERFSVVRALAAVRRCDVALLLIDADEGVSDQDAKIA